MQPHPSPRVQRKMEVLWLKSQGKSHKRIAQLTGISINVVTQYLKKYKAGGIEKLKEFKQFAKQLDIELLFLPAYSPNLNLIERLWKFVKKQCLYSKYYSDFASFKNT